MARTLTALAVAITASMTGIAGAAAPPRLRGPRV